MLCTRYIDGKRCEVPVRPPPADLTSGMVPEGRVLCIPREVLTLMGDRAVYVAPPGWRDVHEHIRAGTLRELPGVDSEVEEEIIEAYTISVAEYGAGCFDFIMPNKDGL